MKNRSKKEKGKRLLFRLLLIILVIAAWQLIRRNFQHEEKEARTYVREAIKEQFPEESAEIIAGFGLKPFGTESSQDELASHMTVLIHGLDDPGKVWMNLAPRLIDDGFQVLIMSYPNDQPIVDSAALFFKELKRIRQQGVEQIGIAAHSMGGLVTREMITNPEYHYLEKAKSGEVPEISRFIMVGSPNHGSELARFRIFTEIRDQLESIQEGRFNWLRPILDGAGEAGVDLLPGSAFLTALNSRPHPKEIKTTVIAGVLAPDIKDVLPADGTLDTLSDWLTEMSNGLGDGLVTVDSARLSGVDLQIVEGSHLTIIRNILPDSEDVPPAIPIILDILSAPEN